MVEALDIGKLNDIFLKSESCDKDLFHEMRNNVRMVSGKQWEKTEHKLYNRVRNTKANEQVKVRLVKNHLNKITRIYINEILSLAPGAMITPHAESELADQKAAELANAVWQDAKHRYNIKEKIRDLAEDYVDLGECAVKIFWDKNKGSLVGYEQEVDEGGNPLFKDPEGNPTPYPQVQDILTGEIINCEPLESDRAVFSGAFVFEIIKPFDLLREPGCDSIEGSRYLIVRKMMDIEEAKLLADDDPKKLAAVQESAQTTFKVFEANSGDYVDSKNQVLIREYYFRPCQKYPKGYVYIATEFGILYEGELPFGIFPIEWCGFQKIQTLPRAKSIIRDLRPLQANINQLSSQQVQHQLSVGDDKLLMNAGSKIERGGELPGVRILKVSGPMPTILEGRTGEQFLQSLQAAVNEMYEIANLSELKEDLNAQLDPYLMLYRSSRQKKKFSLYAEPFGSFLIRVCRLYLKLAQQYLDQEALIKAVGKREHINIDEFKAVKELDYAIKIEEVSDDAETVLGKALMSQTVLQYVGKDLSPEAQAQFISQMPFVDKAGVSEVMANVKNADSDILAMDRGVYVPARKGEKHAYIVQRLMSRMKMKDFNLLSPDIQQAYEQKLQEHQMMISEEMKEKKALESNFIPTGGPLVPVGLYIEVPNSQGGMKTQQWRAPIEGLKWLYDMYEKQKMLQMEYQDLPDAAYGGINQALNAGNQVQGANQMPPPMSTPGQGVM
jgi:hypothetical protein